MEPKDFQSLIQIFIELGQALIPLMASVALLVFALGVGRFIRSTGSETEIKKSKNLVIWGVVGMFVLFTVWGIITFLKGEFDFGGEVGIPQVPITFPNVYSNVVP